MGYARVNIELLNHAKITPTGDDWKIPEDIQNGKAVTFRFEYEWASDNTTCNISNIKWYPSQYHQDTTTPSNSTWWPIINATGTSITNGTKISFDSNGVFDQTGKIKLTFGSTVRAITDKKLSGCYSGNNLNALKDTNTNTNVIISVTNIQAPQLFGSFEYSYKVRYIDYDEEGKNGTWVDVNSTSEISEYSDIEYFIKIDNIRIPKTSKYQNNVVFTKAGVNELIDNIKKYPITSITEISDTDIWNNYTQGKPCLQVTYGDTTKEFSGYKKANGSNQTNKTIGYQYVPVGSNITFPEETTPLPATQATGTIRININGIIHEVPVNGLAGEGNGVITLNGPVIVPKNTGSGKIQLAGLDQNISGDSAYGTAKYFWRSDGSWSRKLDNTFLPEQDDTYNLGTYSLTELATVFETGVTYYVKSGSSYPAADPQPTASNFSNGTYYTKKSYKWKNLYISNNIGAAGHLVNTIYAINLGASNTPITNAYITNLTLGNSGLSSSGVLSITNTTDGIKQGSSSDATNGFDSNYTGTYYGDTRASIKTSGGIYAAKNIWAARVFNAVFNDYAECRSTISLTPGHVVIDQDDGSLACSSKRLQPGAQVISDTYGHLMGQTENATTPIAVAGRVLVYTYQPRENYHAGMAVCSAPDGTVDIMSRAEICEYPDCIVGIVSEIPDYEIWGSDNVKVDGRIWIKVR